jgi:hypothetical protein
MGNPLDDFHAHLDKCEQCRNKPFGLCTEGEKLLMANASETQLKVAEEITKRWRPMATHLARTIVDEANNHAPDAGLVAGLVASLVFQTVAVSILTHAFPAGSAEGERALKEMYMGSMRDAVERWHKPDIAHMKPRCAAIHQDGVTRCEKDAGHDKIPGTNQPHLGGMWTWGRI